MIWYDIMYYDIVWYDIIWYDIICIYIYIYIYIIYIYIYMCTSYMILYYTWAKHEALCEFLFHLVLWPGTSVGSNVSRPAGETQQKDDPGDGGYLLLIDLLLSSVISTVSLIPSIFDSVPLPSWVCEQQIILATLLKVLQPWNFQAVKGVRVTKKHAIFSMFLQQILGIL